MNMSEVPIDTTIVLSLVRQSVALHKALLKQREVAKQLATSLPRQAIKSKTLARQMLRNPSASPEEIVNLLREAEREFDNWRKDNAEIIKQLSVVSTNAWVHIKAISELSTHLPPLPDGE